MLYIYEYRGAKCYVLENEFTKENGILNEKNVRNVLKKYNRYKERENKDIQK